MSKSSLPKLDTRGKRLAVLVPAGAAVEALEIFVTKKIWEWFAPSRLRQGRKMAELDRLAIRAGLFVLALGVAAIAKRFVR